MGRNNADFSQGKGVITLYRGINRHPDHVDTNEAGVHWSTDRKVAEEFATAGMGLPTGRGVYDRNHGTILTAGVDHRDIVPEGSAEHTNWYEGGGSEGVGTYGLNSSEKELTVRRGAIPEIAKVEHLIWNPQTKSAEVQ